MDSNFWAGLFIFAMLLWGVIASLISMAKKDDQINSGE